MGDLILELVIKFKKSTVGIAWLTGALLKVLYRLYETLIRTSGLSTNSFSQSLQKDTQWWGTSSWPVCEMKDSDRIITMRARLWIYLNGSDMTTIKPTIRDWKQRKVETDRFLLSIRKMLILTMMVHTKRILPWGKIFKWLRVPFWTRLMPCGSFQMQSILIYQYIVVLPGIKDHIPSQREKRSWRQWTDDRSEDLSAWNVLISR